MSSIFFILTGSLNTYDQSSPSDQIDFFKTVDKNHGRVETRRYWSSNDLDWFEDKTKWIGLKTIAMVESIRETNNNISCERRYFLVSMDCDAKLFAKACRGHWGVENPLHWTLDVTFGEDNSRARSGNASENLAALRRLALNMLKNESSKKSKSIRGRKLRAGWDNAYLGKVLGI